jgi:hypothetical protein
MLSRRGAVALVNARLASLGHDQDFITVDAVDALHARAGHAADAFGAALGAVLFLAATEHAPRIESRHVELAVPLTEGAVSPAKRPRVAWAVLCASIVGAASGASVVFWLVHRPSAPVPAPILAKPVAVMSHPQTVVVALAPKTIPTPPPPPVPLPSDPPLRVSLVVPAGDRETINRFTSLAARLRQTGFGDVQLASVNSARIETRPLRHHVVYYFRQDLSLAENLASHLNAGLDSKENSSHIRNPWAPMLVSAVAGSNSHPPGSIDVFAP